MSTGLAIAILCAVAALVYGLITIRWVLAKPEGSETMRNIAQAVQEGAQAYLNRQYTTIAVVGILLFALIFITLGFP